MAAMPICRQSRERSFLTLAGFRYRCARRLSTFFGILALVTQVAAWQLPMPGRFLSLQAMADPALHHDHGSGHPGAPGSGDGGRPAHDHEPCPICLTLQLVGSTILPPATRAPVPVGARTPTFHSVTGFLFVSRIEIGPYARAPPPVD